MSRAAKINRGFGRIALVLGGLFAAISLCAFAVGAYQYIVAPYYRDWIEVSAGNKVVLFPPSTDRTTINSVIPFLDALPEPYYGKQAVKYDPSWLKYKAPFDTAMFQVNWEETREHALESASDAALFGIGFLVAAVILYVVTRTFGWVIAGFFD